MKKENYVEILVYVICVCWIALAIYIGRSWDVRI